MEAKMIICLIKDDIAHLEEITREFTVEILPPSDDVDLAIVRAKALITELELLRKLTSLIIPETLSVEPTVIQDHKLKAPEDLTKVAVELSKNTTIPDRSHIISPEEAGILPNVMDQEVIKEDKAQKLVIESIVSSIESPVIVKQMVQDETPIEKESPKYITAKIIVEEHKSINETLREASKADNDFLPNEKIDLGYPVTPIKRIWDAIGINDRFLFVRELFDNNSSKLESTVKTIDEFTSIQEAVNYLKTNFKWNNSEASQRFLVLVKQRFTK